LPVRLEGRQGRHQDLVGHLNVGASWTPGDVTEDRRRPRTHSNRPGGSVWVGLRDEPTAVRVSATTNAVLNRVTVDDPVYSIAATEHAVWAVHNLKEFTARVPPGVVTRIAY
jgi:hypothetical protein